MGKATVVFEREGNRVVISLLMTLRDCAPSRVALQIEVLYAERFVRLINEECLNRVIRLGERHLRGTIAEFVAHYHGERNHQGIGNRASSASADNLTELSDSTRFTFIRRDES